MKSKRLMTIGIVLALLIAVVGVVLSVSLTACGKDVITVRSEKELLKAAGTSQEKTIVLMDDVVVNGDLKVAAPNKIDLNGFGLEVKGTLSADGSGTLVVGTTALILARRETVKAQKIDINMPQGHVEWNAHIDLPASAATSADAMTVVTSASSFVFKGVFKIGGAEADIMLTVKGGRFEISNLSESSAATVLVPEQAVGAAVENLSQGAMRVEAHSDVAVGGEVEISSKNSEVNVTALESQAETKITVTDGTVKKIDAAGAQVVVAESAQAGDVVAEKFENNGTVTGAVVADEIVNNGTLAEENVNAALKTAAKKALNDGFAAYSQDDYTSDNWAKLTKAKDDGLAAIDSALTEAAIQSAKNTALDAMAAVETIAEATARELAEAKTAATEALKTAFEGYTETDYDAQTWATLKAAYDNGLAAIEAATSVSAVDTAKQTAITAMAAVKDNATLLADAKAAALASLDAAKAEYSQDDYATNWSVLEKAYNDGKTEINAAAAIEAVNSALQKATDAMAAVKNDATLLAEAKTAATDQLNSEYAKYKATDYTNANYELLTEKYNAGLSAIGGARTVDAVETALETAIAEMAAIKTNAQILADAKAAAKQAVNEAFAAYNEQDYTVDNWTALVKAKEDGLAAIEAAAKTDAAAEAGEAAIAAMAAVKNNATLLAEAKTAAKSELGTEKAKYSQSDYTINWSVLEQAYNDGLTAIDASKTTSAVDTAKQAAIAAMAAVKTDAEELEAAKSAAKDELKEYFDAFNKAYYFETSLQALQTAYDSGVSAISAAQSVADVATALANAKTALGNVKADVTEVNDADSLKAAVEAQYSKIILTANISGAYIEVNYDLTVDLNGKTLLYTGSGTGSNQQNGEAISVNAGKLVLKNGTVNMVNDEAGGSVYWGIRVHGTGSLAMSKVTVTSEGSPLFMSNVSAGGRIYLTLDECYIEGVYSAVYMNGSSSPAEITINNSTIVSTGDVGIYVSNSVNTGNRQKLTITDSTVTGTTAIEVKHTDATITGCTLIGTAEQLSVKNSNGSCTEGFAFAVTGNGDADKTTGTVVVSGCKFYNGKPSSTDAEENGFYFVFTTAEGASVTVDGAAADETAAYGAYEARVSNAWFDTFENAVKYAEANGKTVVLLKDVEVGEADSAATGLVVSGTLTVDFNGFTVSNVGTGYAVVVSGSDAKVTLIDSSEEQTGGIYGGSGGDNQALRVESGATLDIYGGNYNVGGDAQGEGNSTVSIRTNSTVNIYGGRFASEKDYQGKYFVLNVQQTTGASGYIKVYGGTFVGQNPADGDDALGGSFVADGYEAVVSKAATDESLAEYTVQKAQ